MRMVLVTGAPRSGTTPVGAALALASGAQMIYEPMGPTGDRRMPVRYAIPGQAGLPREVFESFLEDLKELRLDLGAQQRKSYSKMNYAQRLIRSIIGSRTRISYWSARLAPAFDMLVWKDPMASFAVPAVVAHGIPTVLCVRSPLAHAASFKRKGWKVDIAAIYPNYRQCYGAVPEIEQMLETFQPANSVLGASMLWHLVYRLSYRTARGDFGRSTAPLRIVTGNELEFDELGVYRDLYDCLGLAFEGKARRRLEKRVYRAVHDTAKPAKTHDWNRSVSATNSYWKETLDPEEILMVQRLNGWIYEALESLGVLAAKSEMVSGVAALSGTEA